jgi:hypothetical protein
MNKLQKLFERRKLTGICKLTTDDSGKIYFVLTFLTQSSFRTRDMESKSHSHRIGQFKNKSTFKTDEVRRRREAQSVEIRKQKREDNLAKRRNLNAVGNQDMSESEDEMEQAVDLQVRYQNGFVFRYSILDIHDTTSWMKWVLLLAVPAGGVRRLPYHRLTDQLAASRNSSPNDCRSVLKQH